MKLTLYSTYIVHYFQQLNQVKSQKPTSHMHNEHWIHELRLLANAIFVLLELP